MKKDQIKNVDDRKIIGVLSDKKVPVGISESLALHLEQKDRSYCCSIEQFSRLFVWDVTKKEVTGS